MVVVVAVTRVYREKSHEWDNLDRLDGPGIAEQTDDGGVVEERRRLGRRHRVVETEMGPAPPELLFLRAEGWVLQSEVVILNVILWYLICGVARFVDNGRRARSRW